MGHYNDMQAIAKHSNAKKTVWVVPMDLPKHISQSKNPVQAKQAKQGQQRKQPEQTRKQTKLDE